MFFSVLKPSDLDLSDKTDLDFLDCFGGAKLLFQNSSKDQALSYKMDLDI